MPIKPDQAVRYPPDWKQIRQEILERAGHKCENCWVPNYAIGFRYDGHFVVSPAGVLKIVLTVAHLNHDPADCGEPGNRPNLKALCQKCHLAHDHEHHMRNAHQTRRSRKASGDLFA